MSNIPPTGEIPHGCTLHPATELVANLRRGDKVTIFVPNGIGRNGTEWKESTGKVVIPSGTHAALNMGGQYGTPGLVTPQNIVRVGKKYALRD
jgi:hypothetical protein